jgi:hypothetical protein
MFRSKIIYIAVFFFLIVSNPPLQAQTFGFGCLGFFGGYGGYTYQSFKANGLNNFIQDFNKEHSSELENTLQNFNNEFGYRVGVNFFRASWRGGFIVTAKGYYQFLSRKRETSLVDASKVTTNQEFKLDLKNWAVGFDIGFNLTSFLSWKIVDGAVHFNNISLTNTIDAPSGTNVTKYKSDPGLISYSVGTGIIISIIKDYVSLEGLAGYTFLRLEDLQTDDGIYFLKTAAESTTFTSDYGNFIDSGGFTAVVQLNVGFPL